MIFLEAWMCSWHKTLVKLELILLNVKVREARMVILTEMTDDIRDVKGRETCKNCVHTFQQFYLTCNFYYENYEIDTSMLGSRWRCNNNK